MITSLEDVRGDRLTWPEGKPRTSHRTGSAFKGTEVTRAERDIADELNRFGARRFTISRNNQRVFAGDPGVAVWWEDRKKRLRVLACDKYLKLADNLHAIAKTLDAMRGLERWGAYTAEQAAEGTLLALPAPDAAKPWWEVIPGAQRQWPLAAISGMYREAMKSARSETEQRALNEAMEAARKEKGAEGSESAAARPS